MKDERQELIDKVMKLYDDLMELRKRKQKVTPVSSSKPETP
ncbi:hypothetical protein CUS_5583 [Ruminococcus albus 8]|uniref:Uncharacterized protein n=1 Tax=Ruminococcus albus 8 TaxID=246199 RepID=E9S8T8_RUMAL|nr:hypothetical protein CUS_5583 [Ruminococcus albus 8]